MSDETQAAHRLMVCLGDRIAKEGRKVQAWIDVTPEHELSNSDTSWTFWGKGKPVKGARAGGIFEFQGAPEGKWFIYATGTNAPRFVAMFADGERVLRWQMQHKAAGVELEARRLARRQQDEDRLLVQLEPLRSVYRASSFTQKRALLVLILEYMQK